MNDTNKTLNLDQRKRKNATLLVLFDRKQHTRVFGSCHFQKELPFMAIKPIVEVFFKSL